MIDLREKDLQSLRAIAKAILPDNAEVLAYGSRVSGGAHDTSDLDIVIKTSEDKPLSGEDFEDFKLALEFSNIPIIIQVLDWNHIPEHFKPNILRKYFVVQDAEK